MSQLRAQANNVLLQIKQLASDAKDAVQIARETKDQSEIDRFLPVATQRLVFIIDLINKKDAEHRKRRGYLSEVN
jgi:hypothetical protein